MRLVALRRPRLPVPEAVGGGRLRRASTSTPITFDEIRPGCWKQKERLADMDANHVEASICFPNTLPRFCGQTFYERAGQGARAAVRAGLQRLDDRRVVRRRRPRAPDPAARCVPLWDASWRAPKCRRCADKGCFAVTFSENPYPLGLPSVHDGPALGPVLRGVRGDRHRRLHAHRLVVADARPRRPTRRSS